MQYIEVGQVENVISKALDNLKVHYRSDNGRNGWHQYLGSEKIGHIATAQALILLSYCNEDFDNKNLAYEFLISSQQKNENNPLIDGGWAYVTNFSELPTTECTCWSLLALHDKYLNSKEAQNGIKWLLSNHSNTDTDSGWGTIKSDVSRVYSTCLALRVLNKYGFKDSSQFQKSQNWLVKSQNIDMGWGEQFGHKSTVFHTSFVISTLVDILRPNNAIVDNGIEWLTKTFNHHIHNSELNLGSQEIMDFDYSFDGKTKHQRLIYFHTPLPNAVIALVKTGNIFNPNVFLLVQEIVKNNNKGYWKHPNFNDSMNKPLWLIYDMVLSLKIFTQNIQNWSNIKGVELNKNKLSVISNTNPFNFKIFLDRFILGIWGKLFAILFACVFVAYVSEKFPSWTAKNYVAFILIPLIVELIGYYLTEIRKRR